MNRKRISAISLFVLVLVLGTTASTSAYALPHFGVHRHPASEKDERVTVHIRNKAGLFRDVEIGGKVYTVLAYEGLTITAPAGTQVFAASPGTTYRKGDLLFAINPQMQNAIVSIN
jgi:hypothetical protein